MLYDAIPDPHAHPELAILIATLEDSTREWRENLGRVSQAALVWQPYENGPSIGGNILHIVDAECWWLRVAAAGEADDPTRPETQYNAVLNQYGHHWPTPPKKPLKWYYELQDSRRAENHDYIRRHTDPAHLYRLGKKFSFTNRWVVAHIVEHDAYHGGQAVLLHEMYKRLRK